MSNARSSPRRVAGMTLFSVVLACLAILGLVAAFIWSDPAVQVVQLPVGRHMGGRAFFVLAIVFGLTALSASVLIWRMSAWLSLAYGAWLVAALVLGVYVCLAGLGMMVFSAIGLWAVVGFVLYGGSVYLRSRLAKANGSTPGRH
jgi:hypothetical protein